MYLTVASSYPTSTSSSTRWLWEDSWANFPIQTFKISTSDTCWAWVWRGLLLQTLPDYILMITLGKVTEAWKHIVNRAATHDQQSKWYRADISSMAWLNLIPYGMIWYDIFGGGTDTRSIRPQWNIDSRHRKLSGCCSKAVPAPDGRDPTIPSSDHMS